MYLWDDTKDRGLSQRVKFVQIRSQIEFLIPAFIYRSVSIDFYFTHQDKLGVAEMNLAEIRYVSEKLRI